MLSTDRIQELRSKYNLGPERSDASTTPEEKSQPFSSPLTRIAQGKGADNVEIAKGALKQLVADFASAGSHNSPVGQAMLEHSPKLQAALDAQEAAATPRNPLQEQGARETRIAEVAIPTGSAAKSALSLTSEAASALEGITAVGKKGIEAATSQSKVPAQLMQRVARVSKGKQAAFQELAGESIGQYLVKRDIFGTPDQIAEQLYKRFQQSKSTVDDELAKLPGTYKTPAIGSALKQLIGREQRISSPGAISRDLERVRELNRRFNGRGLDQSEINEVKRLYERNIKLEYVKENVPEKVAQANNIDSAIREWQFKTAEQLGFKNLQELNKETQLARQLMDDIGAEYSGQAGNNAISLTDWIALSGGDLTSAAMFLGKKAATSKTIMAKTAKILSRNQAKTPPLEAENAEPTIDNYLEFLKRTKAADR